MRPKVTWPDPNPHIDSLLIMQLWENTSRQLVVAADVGYSQLHNIALNFDG